MPAARAQSSVVFEVTVQLKSEVLDPEGRAIQATLARVGFASVSGISVSKRYVLELRPGADDDAEELANRIAGEYLANPVSETYQVRKL